MSIVSPELSCPRNCPIPEECRCKISASADGGEAKNFEVQIMAGLRGSYKMGAGAYVKVVSVTDTTATFKAGYLAAFGGKVGYQDDSLFIELGFENSVDDTASYTVSCEYMDE